jgi:hypothetical protein
MFTCLHVVINSINKCKYWLLYFGPLERDPEKLISKRAALTASDIDMILHSTRQNENRAST